MKIITHVLQQFGRWALLLVGVLGASAVQAQVAEGRYHIVSRHSDLAMDIADNSSANGANLQQWELDGDTNQQFDVTDLGNGYYSIRPVHSEKSIDVWGRSTEPGGEIRQYDWTGDDNQQWSIESVDSGYQRIVSRYSGLALDVWGWSTDNGGDIRQWTITTGENQHWEFLPVASGSALPIIEEFGAADASSFFSASYKSLASDSGMSFYYALAGSGSTFLADNELTFGNARFSLGNTTPTVTTSSSDSLSNTTGELDLSQPYRVSFCVQGTSGNGSKKFQIYVDNNTTGQANSAHGGASRIHDVAVSNLSAGQRVVVDSTVGTATSFLQIRVESEATVTISDLWIERQSSAQAQPSCSGPAPLVENLSHLIPDAPTPTPHNAIPSGDRTVYVATNGNDNNAGTLSSPYATLSHAVNNSQPGDVIVMRGGVYLHDDTIRINNISGTASKPITVFAYPGEQPILDFTPQTIENNAHGVRLNASYWHLYGLTIRYAGHNGLRMDGSNNRLERLVSHGNYDTGILLAGSASNNLVMNCDSYQNFNSAIYTTRVGNNADGFGAKQLDLGPGNHFYGNRSWENSDDGFDFWRAPNPIVLQNNWTFGNGDASVFGNPENFEGGGNGFKLGGNHDPGDHILVRNVAFNNFGASGNAKGFDHNNNTGALTLLNNTAYNNGRNYVFPNDPADSSKRHIFYNNLSLDGSVQIASGATQGGNSWQEGTPTSSMFESLDMSLAETARQADGSLPVIDLLRPTPTSFMVDGGVNIGLEYQGDAPDIGVYEYTP